MFVYIIQYKKWYPLHPDSVGMWDYIYHEMLRYVEAIYIKIKSIIMVNDAT